MNRKPKHHVRDKLVRPLEQFSCKTVDEIEIFTRHIGGMSPVDVIACIGFLTKKSRDLADAAIELVATVDAQAERVRWMKKANRERRERAEKRPRSPTAISKSAE